MFIPHTDEDRSAMFAAIGIDRMEDLFNNLPQEKLYPKLDLPPAQTELEAYQTLSAIAAANESLTDIISFLGAGAYWHYTPAVVDSIIRRGEFLTAYTPYQPEISQGTLQAIFEYQSLISALTGMDASNASHYDGATAVAEAINMAYHNFHGKRNKVIISPSLNPQYIETVDSYIIGSPIKMVGTNLPVNTPVNNLIDLIDDQVCLVIVQYPDFLGRVNDLSKIGQAAHDAKALFAVHVNPLSLGLLKPPSAFDADIVTGEGQTLGLPLSFGGPYLGIFATKEKYVRKMAGRLVGETYDSDGNRGYVLTLSTREQHIRREKATSNICTNQGLIALASAVYMSLLGKTGLRQVAELNYHKAHYAASRIAKLEGYEIAFDDPFFNEFTITCPLEVAEINEHLLEHDIIGGYDLGKVSSAFSNHMLIAVTEMMSKESIDLLVDVLHEVNHA